MSGYSKACCSIPPVVSEGYAAKGKYVELNGLRTYVTGPAEATKALFLVYDIFGYSSQILQGADILATADSGQSYQVFIPDLFEGNYCQMAWFPPDTEEKGAKVGAWFQQTAQWPTHRPKIPGIKASAEKFNPNIKSWGIMGYCWGGKMASMVASDQPPMFQAAVQTSPAQLDAGDGANVKIPMMLLSSEDESDEETKKYSDSLTVPKHCERFADQVHGFMSARADLKDARVLEEYTRGYQLALSFFRAHV